MAMIQCPRCGSGAPDSATECKICGSPLGEAVQSAPAQPAPAAAGVSSVPNLPGVPGTPEGSYLSGTGGGGEVRVSLTGEVMEIPKPTPRGAGPGGFGPPPGATPAGGKGAPAGPPRPRGAGLAYDEAPKKSSPVGAIVLVLILLIGGGAGGWWWYQKQQAPIRAAESFVVAVKNKDGKALFKMIAWTDEQKKQMESQGGESAGEAQFEKLFQLIGPMYTVKDSKIGEVTRDGDTATVKVTMNIEGAGMAAGQGGKEETKDTKFKLVNGEWKLDGGAMTGGLPGLGAGGGMGAPGGGMGGMR